MADTKISALTDGDPPQDGDIFPVARTGANRRFTWANIKAAITTKLSNIAAGTGAADLHTDGAVTLRTDDLAGAGDTSALDITTGDAAAGNSGNLSVYTGTASGNQGAVLIQGAGGDIQLGVVSNGTSINIHDGAQIDIRTADNSGLDIAVFTGPRVGGNGISGGLYLSTGDIDNSFSGNSGEIELKVGYTDNGVSGNITLFTQEPSTGTQGSVRLQHQGGPLILGGQAKTPASASATGTAGQFAWDASYLYICTASNTWRRVAHATW